MLTQATPMSTIGENHIMQRNYLVGRHARMMQKILLQNINKEKYWILGWAESKRKSGKTKITPMMQALYEMPTLTKESYLYEVDNIEGTKTLLWVMHPNDNLNLPTLGKTIRVAGDRA